MNVVVRAQRLLEYIKESNVPEKSFDLQDPYFKEHIFREDVVKESINIIEKFLSFSPMIQQKQSLLSFFNGSGSGKTRTLLHLIPSLFELYKKEKLFFENKPVLKELLDSDYKFCRAYFMQMNSTALQDFTVKGMRFHFHLLLASQSLLKTQDKDITTVWPAYNIQMLKNTINFAPSEIKEDFQNPSILAEAIRLVQGNKVVVFYLIDEAHRLVDIEDILQQHFKQTHLYQYIMELQILMAQMNAIKIVPVFAGTFPLEVFHFLEGSQFSFHNVIFKPMTIANALQLIAEKHSTHVVLQEQYKKSFTELLRMCGDIPRIWGYISEYLSSENYVHNSQIQIKSFLKKIQQIVMREYKVTIMAEDIYVVVQPITYHDLPTLSSAIKKHVIHSLYSGTLFVRNCNDECRFFIPLLFFRRIQSYNFIFDECVNQLFEKMMEKSIQSRFTLDDLEEFMMRFYCFKIALFPQLGINGCKVGDVFAGAIMTDSLAAETLHLPNDITYITSKNSQVVDIQNVTSASAFANTYNCTNLSTVVCIGNQDPNQDGFITLPLDSYLFRFEAKFSTNKAISISGTKDSFEEERSKAITCDEKLKMKQNNFVYVTTRQITQHRKSLTTEEIKGYLESNKFEDSIVICSQNFSDCFSNIFVFLQPYRIEEIGEEEEHNEEQKEEEKLSPQKKKQKQ